MVVADPSQPVIPPHAPGGNGGCSGMWSSLMMGAEPDKAVDCWLTPVGFWRNRAGPLQAP